MPQRKAFFVKGSVYSEYEDVASSEVSLNISSNYQFENEIS